MERAARLIRNSKQSNSILGPDEYARAIWPSAVGKTIAAHTLEIRVVRSTLVVGMEDQIWKRQLFPLSAQILSRIRAVSGSNAITDIEFRVAAPRKAPARSEVRDTLAGTLPAAPTDECDAIRDPVLKKVYRLSRNKATA